MNVSVYDRARRAGLRTNVEGRRSRSRRSTRQRRLGSGRSCSGGGWRPGRGPGHARPDADRLRAWWTPRVSLRRRCGGGVDGSGDHQHVDLHRRAADVAGRWWCGRCRRFRVRGGAPPSARATMAARTGVDRPRRDWSRVRGAARSTRLSERVARSRGDGARAAGQHVARAGARRWRAIRRGAGPGGPRATPATRARASLADVAEDLTELETLMSKHLLDDAPRDGGGGGATAKPVARLQRGGRRFAGAGRKRRVRATSARAIPGARNTVNQRRGACDGRAGSAPTRFLVRRARSRTCSTTRTSTRPDGAPRDRRRRRGGRVSFSGVAVSDSRDSASTPAICRASSTPFFPRRSQPRAGRPGGGSGLGLAAGEGAWVEAHGGDASAVARPDRRGDHGDVQLADGPRGAPTGRAMRRSSPFQSIPA